MRGTRLVSLRSSLVSLRGEDQGELPVATTIASADGRCAVRCPVCGREHEHVLVEAGYGWPADSLIRRCSRRPAGLYRLSIDARKQAKPGRRPTRPLSADHPVLRARAAGISPREIAVRLGWTSTGSLWGRHTASQLERIEAAVDELIAAKERED